MLRVALTTFAILLSSAYHTILRPAVAPTAIGRKHLYSFDFSATRTPFGWTVRIDGIVFPAPTAPLGLGLAEISSFQYDFFSAIALAIPHGSSLRMCSSIIDDEKLVVAFSCQIVYARVHTSHIHLRLARMSQSERNVSQSRPPTSACRLSLRLLPPLPPEIPQPSRPCRWSITASSFTIGAPP
jgi:hypothetical protein